MHDNDAALPSVFFDESGNTGPDLLNATQPIFALASVRLEADEVVALLRDVRDEEGEAKFSDIRRDSRRRDALLKILGSRHLRPDNARVSVFHKAYMAIAKLVDLLMEPAFYRRGLDEAWRTDGSTLRWPTTLYEIAEEQLGAAWKRLLEVFILAVRQPTREHTADVVSVLDECLGKQPDVRIEFPLSIMREEAEEVLSSSYNERGRRHRREVDPLDPAIAALIEHVDYWGQSIGPFVACHDASDALERSLSAIRLLCDPSVTPYEVAGLDGIARFPLQARRVEFLDSREVPQIQLADLLAGACAFQQGSFERASTDAAFAKALAATGVQRLFAQFVAPPEFVRRSMGELE